jgi:hypothetical protein
MTIQLRICVQLIPALVLLTAISTGARSLAAIDDSVTRGRITWNAADSKQKQIETHNLEEFERRAPIESTGRSLFGRIRHYVGTHKELLASDAVIFAALSADAITSVRCQHVYKVDCAESSRFLPNHPSEFEYWGYLGGQGAVYISSTHLWWHKHPDSPWRHIVWAGPIAVSIYEAFNLIPTYEGFPMLDFSNRFSSEQEGARLREARTRLAP